jgi:methyltransferase (TIGR00027 family)
MSDQEALAGVGKTALGVAYVRAQESRRPDRLFNDPYAQVFVDAAPRFFPATRADAERASPGMVSLGAAFGWHVIIRTRFFDDYLISACANGCRQVVLLAAGLDTRAFRLDWPAGTRLFEVDLPNVMDFKERLLSSRSAQPRCQRTVVATDLRQAWPQRLAAVGFDPGAATAWLAEGLLIYLSADEGARLLADITTLSGADSQLAFEHGNIVQSTVFGQARALPQMREYTTLWKGGLGPQAHGWLVGHGWRVRLHDAAALAESYHRPVVAGASGGYLTAALSKGCYS